MNKRERLENEKRQALFLYVIAWAFQGIAFLGLTLTLICIVADVAYNSIFVIFGGLIIGSAVFAVANTIAHKITVYLYKRGLLKRKGIIRSYIKGLRVDD